MTNDELKTKLGEKDYNELMGQLRAQMLAAQRGQSNQCSSTIYPWLKGALRSWTNWLGALLIAGPEILPLIAPQLKELLDANTYQRVMQIAGIAVILLRFKTTQSVKEKGNA